MTDTTTLIDRYIDAWNEADPHRRRELVAATFADDASYLDPLMSGAGTDGLDAMIAAAQNQFPGHRFVLAGAPDHHHDVVRFVWHLKPVDDDAVVATGHDFATLAPDGRLQRVTGFLEQ